MRRFGTAAAIASRCETGGADEVARRWAALRLGVCLAAVLSACSPGVTAPSDPGVCWHVVRDTKGQTGGRLSAGYRFFVLKRDVPDLEHCATALDAMRVRFLALGGSDHDIAGVFQGQYLFVDPRGVFSAASLQAAPFPMLTRTEDGRLMTPSQASQLQQ